MKRAVCICGGAGGRGGAAARLLAETRRGLAEAGLEVQTFHLDELEIGFCSGCGECRGGGRCARNDGLQAVTDALERSDVVCVCGHCRFAGADARLQAFFERSLPPAGARAEPSVPGGKIGISAAVCAGRSVRESAAQIDAIERWFLGFGIRPAGQLHAEGIGSPEDLERREDALYAAYDAGRRVLIYGGSGRATFSLAVASPRDAASIAWMSAALLKENGMQRQSEPRRLEKSMRRQLAGEYSGILAWVSGKVAGYFLYRPETGREGKRGYRLEQWYIKPEYRHRGLGPAALRRIVDICFRDAETLSVVEYDTNIICASFWAASSCRPCCVRFTKPIPVFSQEDPFKIIGWEPKRAKKRSLRSALLQMAVRFLDR